MEEDRRAAVSVLFECQGSAHATSSALDRVLLGALGVVADATLPVCLPPLREAGPSAVLTDGRCTTVRGHSVHRFRCQVRGDQVWVEV